MTHLHFLQYKILNDLQIPSFEVVDFPTSSVAIFKN
jgi:hypothetical protein